ncbi:hypothetical protein [Halobacillus sp. B23F22_1]
MSYPDYFFMITRTSIIITLIVVLLAAFTKWVHYQNEKRETDEES